MSETLRRAETPRRTQSRWPWVWWALAVICAVLWWMAYQSTYFSVQQVSVNGAKRLSKVAVLNQAQVPLGVQIVRVDTAGVEAALAKLPEVDTAVVERGWPHTIAITITERKPVAYTVHGGDFVLVDVKGHDAGTVKNEPRTIAKLLAGLNTPVTEAAAQVAERLPKAWEVDTVQAQSRDTVTVNLKNATIIFGSSEHLAQKVKVAEALLENGYRTINVSAPDAPTTIGPREKKHKKKK